MVREQGPFNLNNRWNHIAWGSTAVVVVASFLLGFLVLGRYQQNGPTLDIWASMCRATRLEVWWQTGQFGTTTTASTAFRCKRARISGASVSMVTRWLRLVGAPWNRAATRPMRPAAAARRKAGSGNQLLLSVAVVWIRS